MKSKRRTSIVLLILLVGLLLRLYHLGNESLWLDEGFSLRMAKLNIDMMWKAISGNVQSPLYYGVLHYWIAVFGNTEAAARMLSVIFGSLTLIMIYLVGRLLFNEAVGIMASTILALSPFHIFFSQEARMYTLLVLLSACSMFCFLSLFRNKKFFYPIGYLLFSFLLLYTHNFGFSIILAQNIFVFTLLVRYRKIGDLSGKRWGILQIILLTSFLAWLGTLINQWLRIQKSFWMGPVSIRSIWMTLLDYSGSPLLFTLFILLVARAVFSACRQQKGSGKSWLEILKKPRRVERLNNFPSVYLGVVWLLTPILLPWAISRIATPVYISRITIPASLAFYLLAARGVRAVRSTAVQIIVPGIIISASLVSLASYYSSPHKERWREVTEFIDTRAESGDLLLFNAGAYQANVFDYYSTRNDLLKKLPPGGDVIDETNLPKLKSLVAKYPRVWLILCQSRDRRELMKKTLDAQFNLTDRRIYPYRNFQARREMNIELCLFEARDETGRNRGVEMEPHGQHTSPK